VIKFQWESGSRSLHDSVNILPALETAPRRRASIEENSKLV
jgi:hypothetical protein